MHDDGQFECFFVQYAPNSLEERTLNIGVVLIGRGHATERCFYTRFISEWETVQKFDPDADIEMLKSVTIDLERQLTESAQREETLRMIQESFSNAIRISSPKPCLRRDPEAELDVLTSQLLR